MSSETIVVSNFDPSTKTTGTTADTGCYRPRSFVSHVSWLGSMVVIILFTYRNPQLSHPISCTGGSFFLLCLYISHVHSLPPQNEI